MSTSIPQTAPPVLSTPETNLFSPAASLPPPNTKSRLSDEQIWDVYEVARTARELWEGRWQVAALQFPDAMLSDAVKVFGMLEKECKRLAEEEAQTGKPKEDQEETSSNRSATEELEKDMSALSTHESSDPRKPPKLYILADTSYGACCVDEIAAEHVAAQVVVHYGRSCLSPTARLPVIYVYTTHSLSHIAVISAFEATYTERGKEAKVLLLADLPWQDHVFPLATKLRERGWINVVAPGVVRDPEALVPNRDVKMEEEELREYSLFHIAEPPQALLLTLNSRVKDLYIYPTTNTDPSEDTTPNPTTPPVLQQNTFRALKRRYALLTSLSTCSIFGILINTLSVKNYLSTVTAIQQLIRQKGKKSYTFVVGKVNGAKIANFAEVGGWVVVGCWESCLLEDTAEGWFRGCITPWELRLALEGDETRVWNGQWKGGLGDLAQNVELAQDNSSNGAQAAGAEELESMNQDEVHEDADSEEESLPPEFDLRTGRYISHSRPLRTTTTTTTPSTSHPPSSTDPSSTNSSSTTSTASKDLTRRAKTDLATINGAVSPGAEYLRSQRTWTGLGSDFHEVQAGDEIREGRSGVARGYRVGDEEGGERR